MMSCLRDRARFSRPIDSASSTSSDAGLVFNSARFIPFFVISSSPCCHSERMRGISACRDGALALLRERSLPSLETGISPKTCPESLEEVEMTRRERPAFLTAESAINQPFPCWFSDPNRKIGQPRWAYRGHSNDRRSSREWYAGSQFFHPLPVPTRPLRP